MSNHPAHLKLSLLLTGLLTAVLLSQPLFAQDGLNKVRKKAGRPEKWWAVCHPFIAKKAVRLTLETSQVLDSLKAAGTLGNDLNGGQLDAFKHSYWMALLSQNIKWKKAWKLGKAHEKSNYLSFKKALKKGENNCHDKAASDMDLWNNNKGIEIGKLNKFVDRLMLQQIILDSIQSGAMRIILKNEKGQFLNCHNNEILADSLVGKWENEKCLVTSDVNRKKN